MDEIVKANGEERGPAAYLPFRTFLSAFDVFDHGVPHKVDRSLWRNQSGVVQGQIMMALRFFSLIDENEAPRAPLERFVTNKDKRKEYVGALLHHAYSHILDRDLTKMSPKLLSDEMDKFGLSGETKRKATAFFLQAARFAELPMHPLLNSQTRLPSNGPGRKKKKAARMPSRVGGERSVPPTPPSNPKDGESKSVKLKSGATVTLTISANWLELPSEERKFVFELIDLLQSPSASVSKDDGEAS